MFSIVIGSFVSFYFTSILSMNHPQSHLYLSGQGFTYQPKSSADWLDHFITNSVGDCARKCNLDYKCRTFVYNAEPDHCHLYQNEPDDDQIVFVGGKHILGFVRLTFDLYLSYNKTCEFCENDRYLFCDQGYCRCPWNSWWDGFICRKQKYSMEICSQNVQCRDNPYRLTCNEANIYIPNQEGFPPSVRICSQNVSHIIFNKSFSTVVPYFQTNFSFVAKTISIAVNFIFLDHSAYWLVDDVILYNVNTSQNVLQNGHFESGTLIYWNCYQSNTNTSKVISNGSFPSKSGNYSFLSGAKPDKDYLTQIIPTEIDKFYEFSFWLSHTGNSSNNFATVTIVY